MTTARYTLTLPPPTGCEGVLSDAALDFAVDLELAFRARRRELLERRAIRQAAFDRGELPHFLPETQELRAGDWTVAPIPADLQRRWVEITGPTERKMIINALNSGADVFMADCEDASSPTWDNAVQGQQNLCDAVRRTIAYTDLARQKHYALGPDPAVLLVRPRGWHLDEKHVLVDGQPMSGSLFDFGLYFFHNAHELLARHTGPYFYLPKLESHLEARLWNDVFLRAQERLGLPEGTIKATVLIETLPAAFEMNELLWELRAHITGLNCGRWDYIFSYIKTFRAHRDHVLPDRGDIGMTQPFMRAYTQLVIQTCHRRGAFAMGGMAAQIPIKDDPAANEAALAKVRADKQREVDDGHDGTWVAHPGLVPVARAVFAARMGDRANQLDHLREDVCVSEADLLALPVGRRTQEGLHHNIRVGVQYLAAWLDGSGCVPLYHLMEDAATAEISRAQLWQWVRHEAHLNDGSALTATAFEQALACEMAGIRNEVGAAAFDSGRYAAAAELFRQMVLADAMPPFLTLAAYDAVVADGR